MMSESSKAIIVFSTPRSSSRLSPLARPFTIRNPFNRRESFDLLVDSSSSTSSPDQPFSYLSLGGQGQHHDYHADQYDATAITAFPFVNDLDFETNSCFTYYHSDEPPVQTHITLPTPKSSQTNFIPISSSFGNVGPKSGSAVSLSCSNLHEQGTTIEGSKLVSETSSVLHGQDSVVIGKGDQIRPEDKDKINTESSIFRLANSESNLLNKCMTKSFSISSDLPFTPRPQDSQSQLPYSAPLLTLSHCDSTIMNDERCFPDFASCGAETLVSCAPECFSYSAQIFKPSGASSNPPMVNPVPLETVASGSDAVSNMDSCFGYVVPSMIDTDIVQSPVEKVACHDPVITEKGEKRKIVEPVHNEIKIAKSKLQIACPSVHEDLTLEHGAKAGIPDAICSTNHDDSDIDSPCWKGTQAYKSPFRDSAPVKLEDSKGQSPSRVSVSLKLEHSKNEKVAHNSLNPLAPVFIPRSSKQKINYHQKECRRDSSPSPQNIGDLAVISSSEHGLMGSVKAVTCPSERINDIGIHCSNHTRDSRKEYGTPYKSFRSSVVNSSCSFQPYLMEEYLTSESQLVRGTNVAGFMEGIEDAKHNALDSVEDIAHNGPNTSISFLTTEIALNSPSTGVGVFSDLTEGFQEPSKSTLPKLDVKLMINTIQYLSELLLQNYSFALGSLSEHEHDKIVNIIDNLFVIIRNQAGERAIRPESRHLRALYGQRQAADNFEVTEKDPKAIHSIESEMRPEALFYRKLWLEAKAALYLMKYQAHALHMKPEPDRC